VQQLGHFHRGGRQCLDVEQVHRLGCVLHQVQHVVHARDQPVDVIAVERCDERGMQHRDGLVRDAVGAALDVADALDEAGPAFGVAVMRHQLDHRGAALDDQGGVAIEIVEKPRLARHQGGKEPHLVTHWHGFRYRASICDSRGTW
jgi:hypothetical protein